MEHRKAKNEKNIIGLEERVISSLGEDITTERKLLARLRESLKGKPKKLLYQYLLFILSHLHLDNDESAFFWKDITRHRKELQKKLGRNVSFRVALLDYFTYVNRKIKNPKIIEIALYMDTLRSTLVDNLTGVYNNRYMEKAFNIEIKRAVRYKRKFSAIFLDIDNFKNYNDNFGHLSGDMALKEIAAGIKGNLRAMDIVCRYGGEEFIIILPFTDKRKAFIVGERIRRRIQKTILDAVDNRYLTISGGISTFPQDGGTIAEILDTADIALYKAKRSGKNQIIKYTKELLRNKR